MHYLSVDVKQIALCFLAISDGWRDSITVYAWRKEAVPFTDLPLFDDSRTRGYPSRGVFPPFPLKISIQYKNLYHSGTNHT